MPLSHPASGGAIVDDLPAGTGFGRPVANAPQALTKNRTDRRQTFVISL
jgi:hypothetical protein